MKNGGTPINKTEDSEDSSLDLFAVFIKHEPFDLENPNRQDNIAINTLSTYLPSLANKKRYYLGVHDPDTWTESPPSSMCTSAQESPAISPISSPTLVRARPASPAGSPIPSPDPVRVSRKMKILGSCFLGSNTKS